jgi:hypothetical protein
MQTGHADRAATEALLAARAAHRLLTSVSTR